MEWADMVKAGIIDQGLGHALRSPERGQTLRYAFGSVAALLLTTECAMRLFEARGDRKRLSCPLARASPSPTSPNEV